MKLNLLLGSPKDVRSGFLNLDPLSPPDDPDRNRYDWTNLNEICCDGEATEIVAQDILDALPRAEAEKVLGHWLTKLGHGGTLTLVVLDTLAVCRAAAFGDISPQEAGLLLYGDQQEAWRRRQSDWTLPRLMEWFSSRGMEVIKQRVQFHRAVVVVRRP